ncbi:Creatininase [Desulfofarcimen acetoxidans DSM 771]|uniref:Creatininase n=1 Tax=Desulfofarcimen acetoxidans (strain ATCC 49208 / DSM 771 / KCTC 5769 / VKM B-1644 / 5575) TaxID=485916 RepID=C8VVK2_DESAS|nr:creatininase family protein [Desulfofarcimen acetoxidans]ACV62317.1 Creatininase [Desulfofarcimen acetoxidans DSM 771]
MLTTNSKWPELTDVEFAILPVGSIEQHGWHLPLSTDSLIANGLATKLAGKFNKSYLLPLFPFTSSFEHSGFPGSVSLKVSTIAAVIEDILDSLEFSNIKKCVIVNGHQGNHFLRNVVQELNRFGPRVLLTPSKSAWDIAYQEAGISTTISKDMHAGEGETSLIMHLNPETINPSGVKDVDSPSRPLFEVLGMKRYTDTGAIGFPSRATEEKGVALLNILVKECEKVIMEFVENE